MILDDILAHKRTELKALMSRVPRDEIARRAVEGPPVRDFRAALTGGAFVAVIAEVKRASPSAGIIRGDLDPADLAKDYESSGASAVSVLTDERYFRGRIEDLRCVRDAVALPILRKEFVIEPYQVYESRAAGADAVLLIVAALEMSDLAALMHLADELGMTALVEVHNQIELDRALDAGAGVIGINNRNLATFEVDLAATCDLAPHIPDDRIIVSESGIRSRADVERVAAAGAAAVLVGTGIVADADPSGKLHELARIPRNRAL